MRFVSLLRPICERVRVLLYGHYAGGGGGVLALDEFFL